MVSDVEGAPTSQSMERVPCQDRSELQVLGEFDGTLLLSLSVLSFLS